MSLTAHELSLTAHELWSVVAEREADSCGERITEAVAEKESISHMVSCLVDSPVISMSLVIHQLSTQRTRA